MTSSHAHYQVIASAIDYLRTHAHEQPALADVASAVHMSEYHLQRTFSAWAGITPKRFLQHLTKEQALAALKASEDVLSVAAQVGLSGGGRLHDLMVTCEAMSPGEIKTQGEGVVIHKGYADTPLGEALFGWTKRGVCFLEFVDAAQSVEARLLALWPKAQIQDDSAGALALAQQIFSTTPTPGRLHLVLKGSNFQLKVWEALLKTAPGQLVDYGQLAALASSPNAQRAVGSALAANHIALLIPCHRVIRRDGDTGQYRWGTTRKLAAQLWEQPHS